MDGGAFSFGGSSSRSSGETGFGVSVGASTGCGGIARSTSRTIWESWSGFSVFDVINANDPPKMLRTDSVVASSYRELREAMNTPGLITTNFGEEDGGNDVEGDGVSTEDGFLIVSADKSFRILSSPDWGKLECLKRRTTALDESIRVYSSCS